MTAPSLSELRKRRERDDAKAAASYAALLDRALELAGEEDANVTAIAAEAGIARATVYNELARREEHRTALETNGAGPPPAEVPVA